MDRKTHLTTGEIAAELGVPGWMVRRAVDALGENIPRAGLYRLIPSALVDRVRAEVQKHIARAVAGEEAAHHAS
jgi:hypothetical protein